MDKHEDWKFRHADLWKKFLEQNPVWAAKLGYCRQKPAHTAAEVNKLTPLHYAAMTLGENTTDTISHLLERGPEVDAKVQDEIMHIACCTAKIDAVRILLNRKASVGSRDPKGKNGLMYALLSTEDDVLPLIKMLVEEFGASVSSADEDGMTPLMYAARENSPAVEYLISVGSDVNAVDNKGECALRLAVKYQFTNDKHRPNIELLCKNGADMNRASARYGYYNWTPLQHAVEDRDIETMMILLRYGSCLSRALRSSIGDQNERDADDVYVEMLLIVAGVFVDRPWNYCFTDYKDVWDKSQITTKSCAKQERNHSNSSESDSDDNSDSDFETYIEEIEGSHLRLEKLCRFNVRSHLMSMNPDRNLVYLVEKLTDYLPKRMREFLLYNFPLDNVNRKYPLYKKWVRELVDPENRSESDSSSDDSS